MLGSFQGDIHTHQVQLHMILSLVHFPNLLKLFLNWLSIERYQLINLQLVLLMLLSCRCPSWNSTLDEIKIKSLPRDWGARDTIPINILTPVTSIHAPDSIYIRSWVKIGKNKYRNRIFAVLMRICTEKFLK